MSGRNAILAMIVFVLGALASPPAMAGPAAEWVGEWALDPVRSDNADRMLQRAVRAPMLDTPAPSTRQNLSPDRAAQDDQMEEARRRVMTLTTTMLARSARISIREPEVEGLIVEFGGEEPMELTLTRKWTKTRRDGSTLRMRAFADGQLTLERRIKTMRVVETLLPPDEDGTVYAVVQIVGSGMETIEFRRVYRALSEEDAGSR